MINVIKWFLILNLVSAIYYGYIRWKKQESLGVILMIITIPILGYFLYLIPLASCKRRGEYGFDREVLVNRHDRTYAVTEPLQSVELDVVPIGDALAASKDSEKRALILNQLREDLGNNYKLLLRVKNDSDTECVHYVAAAKMEVYSRLQKEYSYRWSIYLEKQNVEAYHIAMKSLSNLIESNLLSDKEMLIYKKRYIENMESQKRDIWDNDEIVNYTNYLVDYNNYEKVDVMLKAYRSLLTDEALFLKILGQTYSDRNEKVFKTYLKRIEYSRNLTISKTGKATINRLVGLEV
ncbi:MAG: hypothetical protein ACK5LL_06440 [Suipraeoptans sp.]